VKVFAITILMFCASTTLAQGKFFSTPGRGAEGAKQNAQVTTLQGENERMNACTAAGRIYAPTHPNKDANDCIPHLLLNPNSGQATFTNRVNVNSGGVSITGASTFNNGVTVGAGGMSVTGNATLNNNLAVTGTSVFGGNTTVNGRVTANQLYVGGGNVGSIPSCASAQKLQWNGTAWTCVVDNVGATAATEVDPKVGALTNGRWCRTDGSRVICDVNVPVVCGTAQKLQWNGSAWICAADQGILTETDPSVGTITNGKWCAGSGGKVVCSSDGPSGGFSSCVTRTGSANYYNSSVNCGAGEVMTGGGCLDSCAGVGSDNCTAQAIKQSVPASNGWSCLGNNRVTAYVRCCS